MSAKQKPDNCRECEQPFTDHYGIEVTCRKLREARAALKIISTWANFRGGASLNGEDTAKLCERALAASEP